MSAGFDHNRWLNWKPSHARSEETTTSAETGSEGFEGAVSALSANSVPATRKIAFNPDRWLKWKPSDTRPNEPTKPSESSSDVFEGTVSVPFENLESVAERIAISQMQWAEATLFKNGARIIELDGVMTVGIWGDLDSKDLRDAAAIRFPGTPTSYLDQPDVPAAEKIRKVAGEPLPLSVVSEMEKCHSCPWLKRDELLAAMNWNPQGTLWTEENVKTTRTPPSKPAKPREKDGFVGSVGSGSSSCLNKKKSHATVFQHSFFEELWALFMSVGEVELQERAERLGKPREAVNAFIKAHVEP